jgi:CRISPR-associated protein Cmr3
MRYYRIEPLDTLFFRDGSPFNAGETGQMEIRGVFPPTPTTVAGSLRAAFARQLGWEEGAWGANIISRLGNGDHLGPLRFRGPYLARDGEPFFPAPLHLLRAGGTDHISRLKPGDDELQTDIGVVRLPEAEKRDSVEGETGSFKPLENAYLTSEAMREVLNWELPGKDGIIPSDRLWSSEARIGILRDRETRTTKEDALYQTVHVRLERGVGLLMGVDGYEGSTPEIATLGGESRMVSLERCDRFALPEAPDIQPSGGSLRYTVTLITPARLPDDGRREPGRPPGALPGNVVSACVGKPVVIGGWDSVNRCPKPLEPHLPAGSMLFMKAREDEKEEVLERHGTHIGERTEWGYGQILIGAWR